MQTSGDRKPETDESYLGVFRNPHSCMAAIPVRLKVL
jgi:hypothetical protein